MERILFVDASTSWTEYETSKPISNFRMIMICSENINGIVVSPVTLLTSFFKTRNEPNKNYVSNRYHLNSNSGFEEIDVAYIDDNTVNIYANLASDNNRVSIYGIR